MGELRILMLRDKPREISVGKGHRVFSISSSVRLVNRLRKTLLGRRREFLEVKDRRLVEREVGKWTMVRASMEKEKQKGG